MKALFNQSSLFKITIFMALFALLSGCGATTKSIDGLSDNGVVATNGVLLSDGSQGTKCNGFASATANFYGKVETYVVNGQLQMDQVRLRITGLPSTFDSNSNLVIKIFRWNADTSTGVSLDSTPVSFIVQNGTGAISSSMSEINTTIISSLRSGSQISGTSSAEFLNNTSLIVSGVDYTWDALKIVIYNGTDTYGSTDVLLPVFSANPNTYAANHASVLAQLHPLYSSRGQSMSDTQWLSQLSAYCF